MRNARRSVADALRSRRSVPMFRLQTSGNGVDGMTQRVRKLIMGAISAALALGGAGCSGADEPTGGSGRNPTVAFVVPVTELSFAKEMTAGFIYGVRTTGGVESMVTGTPRMDKAGEAKIFEQVVKSGQADAGISLFMHAADIFAPLVTEAHKKKIPMIAVDNPMDATGEIKLFVGNDNYVLGQMLADEAIEKLPPGASGDIVIGDVAARRAGPRTARQGHARRVCQAVAHGQRRGTVRQQAGPAGQPEHLADAGGGEPGRARVSRYWRDADAYNLADIRKATKGKWLAGAYDLDARSLAAVKRRGDLLLVSPEHFIKGAVAGRIQAQHAKDGKVLPTGWIYTPGLVVSPTNIDDILKRQQSDAAKEIWFKDLVESILIDPRYLRSVN